MTAPRILFRADASPDIGGGHIMRCLTLARALTARGARCEFLTSSETPASAPALSRSGFPVHTDLDKPPPADALVCDHYGLDAEAERALKKQTGAKQLAAIDDLRRKHACDMLIDHNYGKTARDYAGLVPKRALVLAGAHYALLDPAFAAARAATLARRAERPPVRRIVISLGLVDPGGATAPCALAARRAVPEADVEAILGPKARSRAALEEAAGEDGRLQVTIDAEDMAARLASADLAVGAGGVSALERCTLGLPSVTLILADNQAPLAHALEAAGAAVAVEARHAVYDTTVAFILAALADDPAGRVRRSDAAAAICDGEGAARAASAILERLA